MTVSESINTQWSKEGYDDNEETKTNTHEVDTTLWLYRAV